jgi:PAS domain S-box-containing protein
MSAKSAPRAQPGLRERAERLLRKTRDEIHNMPSEDIAEIVHELQVHQIELSMQNDELHRTQEELEASHQKYYDLYDYAPIGYITLDQEGSILEANLMAGTIFGLARDKLVGKKLSAFIKPYCQNTYYLHYQKVFQSIAQQTCELELISQKGSRFVQLYSLAVAGNEDCCRTAITDMTAIKQMESDLKQARDQALAASQAKSEFLANMSHEMRTPLNAITGIGHLLMKSQPLTAKQKKYIETLQLSADSLLGLISEVLDIAKIETCVLELEHIPFDLPKLVSDALHMMHIKAQEKGLELVMENQLNLHPTYYGDPSRIRQIVLNLLGNALKFTEKGKITLRLNGRPRNQELMDIMITVKDSGIGIPAKKRDDIFENFTQADASITRKFGGTGLGLAICKKLVERMGGTISVNSMEGKGSTFVIHLPLAISEEVTRPEGKHKEASSTVIPMTQRKPHILLVEDYQANIIIAETYLESLNCTCDIASSGMEAIRKLEKNRYDLILMDVQMHDMDGYETTKYIRKMEQRNGQSSIPIIAVTAHALTGDKEKCLAAGMNDYISKPFSPKELARKLECYLKLKNLSPAKDSTPA